VTAYLRKGSVKQHTGWPTLQDRRDPPTVTGESGPITPVEEHLFRENPEQFAGDPRFFGKLPRQNNEDYG
jgi:hypothetical protein